MDAFSLSKPVTHKVAKGIEDRFYVSFGQRGGYLDFLCQIVRVDMLEVDYACVISLFVLLLQNKLVIVGY